MTDFLKLIELFPVVGLITAGVLGLLVGSFLNVVIYRMPKMIEREYQEGVKNFLEERNLFEKANTDIKKALEFTGTFNLVAPRSTCPCCGHKIKSWENIPIFSYVFLRGKCSSCKTGISIRYPLIEFVTGLFSVGVIYYFGNNAAGVAAVVLTWALIALTMIDADTQLLPDDITLPLMWLGLFANTFHLFTSIESAIFGAIAGYLSLWSIYWLFKFVTGKEGFGYGDFKLLAALGAWLGWQMLPQIIMLSALVGAVYGIFTLLTKGNNKIPYGPYLATAGWIALMWGQEINDAYLIYAGIKH